LSLEVDAKARYKNDDGSSDIIRWLKEIREENASIAELKSLEEYYVKDMADILAELLRDMNLSFNISTETMKKLGMEYSKVSLTPNSDVRIVDMKGRVSTTKLADMPSSVVITILALIMPHLKEALTARKVMMRDQAGVLERMVRQLKDMRGVNHSQV
jgi:hypothetical protein